MALLHDRSVTVGTVALGCPQTEGPRAAPQHLAGRRNPSRRERV